MLDHTDIQILDLLRENSRLQWKEIGKLESLSGQVKRIKESIKIKEMSN